MRLIWFFWQIPQHLAALILFLFFKITNKPIKYNSDHLVLKQELKLPEFSYGFYDVPGFKSAVCLGEFIFIDTKFLIEPSTNIPYITFLHEHGHRIQSRILGPFYLLIVGIPSALRNLYSRYLFRKGVPVSLIKRWYYSQFPENWADKLMNIKREF